MDKKTLALFGGRPANDGALLKSKPYITEDEKTALLKLLEKQQFSRFVGSPLSGTYEDLPLLSKNTRINGEQSTFLGGQHIRNFEADWSEIVNSKYSISVNSATSGLTTALLSLDLEPGTIVLTTPFSFTGTVGAIMAANCVPKFSDIDEHTFCLSPEKVSKDIENVGCVMPVHWCGNAGDLDEIIGIAKDKGVPVIEDAAQAPASLYKDKFLGTHGDLGVFSFNEPKNLMTGEGGIVVTDNEELAVKARLIRNHGEAIVNENFTDEQLVNIVGYNFRLTELQAAIGIEQLKKTDKLNKIRSDNYKYLVAKLQDICGEYLTPQKITHPESYYAYTASFRWNEEKSGIKRRVLATALEAEGIPAFTAYGKLLAEHPMFQRKIGFGSKGYPWSLSKAAMNLSYDISQFPNADKVINKDFLGFLCLGWPNTFDEMDLIGSAFDKIIQNKEKLSKFDVDHSEVRIGR